MFDVFFLLTSVCVLCFLLLQDKLALRKDKVKVESYIKH